MSSERSARPGSRETSHSLNTIGGLVGREFFLVFTEKHSSGKQGDLAQRWHSPRCSSSDRKTAVLKEVAGQESFI